MPNLRAIASRAGLTSTPMIRFAPTSFAPWMTFEADAAEAEDDDVRAGLDLGREEHRADAGRHAAADVADDVERRVGADLRERDLGHDDVVRERRRPHVVQQRLAVEREAARAVGHQSLALRRADLLAEVGLPRQAELALPALGRVERDDVVVLGERRHARRRPRRRRPAPSWPRIAGNRPSGSSPDKVNQSVWQMPVALTSTSTSPARGPSRSTGLDRQRARRLPGDRGARLHRCASLLW
jgi:hypothetical protein